MGNENSRRSKSPAPTPPKKESFIKRSISTVKGRTSTKSTPSPSMGNKRTKKTQSSELQAQTKDELRDASIESYGSNGKTSTMDTTASLKERTASQANTPTTAANDRDTRTRTSSEHNRGAYQENIMASQSLQGTREGLCAKAIERMDALSRNTDGLQQSEMSDNSQELNELLSQQIPDDPQHFAEWLRQYDQITGSHLAEKHLREVAAQDRQTNSDSTILDTGLTALLKSAGMKDPERPITPAEFEKMAELGMLNRFMCDQRQLVDIPFEVLEHVRIYYEEGLSECIRYFCSHVPSCPFMQPLFDTELSNQPTSVAVKHANKLLNCICISGAGTNRSMAPPAFIPPPSYIRILSTVMVHPEYTTHPKINPDSALECSQTANVCLKNILDYARSPFAVIVDALRFSSQGPKRGRSRRLLDNTSERSDTDTTEIKHRLSNEQSLWNVATDFWHIVGWALNCSIMCRDRWHVYTPLLDFITDAIGMDLEKNEEARYRERQSILGHFLEVDENPDSEFSDHAHTFRRALHAIFADGTEQSVKMYPEIWKGESTPKVYKKNEIGQTFGRKVVDLRPYSAEVLGGDAATNLRCTLLSAVISFEYLAFGGETAQHYEFYSMLVDCLLQRPLKEFHAYLKGFHERLYEPAFSSLLQSIIYRLIDNKAPRNPNSDDRYDLDVMMNCFYPYAANTSSPDANARLSICIEQMHSLLSIFGGDCLKIVLPINFPDEEVMKVINEGTAARREKCAADDKKKMPAKAKSKQMKADVDARMNLIRSGESIARSMNGWFEIQKILRRRANGEICGYYGGADAHLNEIARQNDAR